MIAPMILKRQYSVWWWDGRGALFWRVTVKWSCRAVFFFFLPNYGSGEQSKKESRMLSEANFKGPTLIPILRSLFILDSSGAAVHDKKKQKKTTNTRFVVATTCFGRGRKQGTNTWLGVRSQPWRVRYAFPHLSVVQRQGRDYSLETWVVKLNFG